MFVMRERQWIRNWQDLLLLVNRVTNPGHVSSS